MHVETQSCHSAAPRGASVYHVGTGRARHTTALYLRRVCAEQTLVVTARDVAAVARGVATHT